MATTQEILQAATNLGKMIATHPASAKVQEVATKLHGDVEAQRALNDFNRLMQKLEEKQAAGQPIEGEEKKQLEKLQAAVIKNALLRNFQMAQMDYLDLMRQVDEAMNGGPAEPQQMPAQGAGAPPSASKIKLN